MPRNGRITSWSELNLQHLVYAYRKAKADCFYERTPCVAERFVAYESRLYDHLTALLHELRAGSVTQRLLQNLGKPVLVAKKLSKRLRPSAAEDHGFYSDPRKAFDFLKQNYVLTPEFRVIGDFPVEMHVLSALWINTVGHLFDACLGSGVYGARLRRYRPDVGAPSGTLGEFHLDAIDSFQPYFSPYKKWRSDGFKAMNVELSQERSIIALSLDLKSYYHSIDPSFIAQDGFQLSLGVHLNAWEQSFTSDFSSALCQWAKMACETIASVCGKDSRSSEDVIGGIPIGLSASRLIANVLLDKFDRLFKQELLPVYYGRYVDDIFVVLRDPENIYKPEQLMDYIGKRMRCFKRKSKGTRKVDFGKEYQARSRLEFQDTKHKVFFLTGQGGADFLNTIEEEIASVSSERRLMPNLDSLDKTAAARVLTAAGTVAEEADSLRRADGLSVRRLGWSIQLRSVETLAHDLRPEDWRVQRQGFYEFAKNHILRPDKVLDHIDYLPRLLSLAVALQDWGDATQLVALAVSSLRDIENSLIGLKEEQAKVNGYLIAGDLSSIWHDLDSQLRSTCADAVLRAWRMRETKYVDVTDSAKTLCEFLGLPIEAHLIHERARALRENDWAKVPYKDHVRRYTNHYRKSEENEGVLFFEYRLSKDLQEFLDMSVRSVSAFGRNRLRGYGLLGLIPESRMPYLFPTRPYSAQEIALLVPECIDGEGDNPVRLWARLVRAVRGVWVWPHLLEGSDGAEIGAPTGGVDAPPDGTPPSCPSWRRIGKQSSSDVVRLGITSLYTSDDTWRQSAGGKPDLSIERYERIGGIVKQAVTVWPRPTHLLLPELALPERWLDSVAGRLRDAGISLISGLDYYDAKKNDGKIYSDAVLILTDDRLGYPSTIQIRQKKSQPAPREDQDLFELFGHTWDADSKPKPVYEHRGFCFGVLVCSELQNISHRHHFQGHVDAVLVLAWNQDLETFSALVESAALDVHACIALANNRKYGDSRVRVPAKELFKRDLCRVRGGLNDYMVVVEFNPMELRQFQSRAKNWSREDDLFKPLPEGFQLDSRRRVTPL
jgi:hypothetical protein